MDDNIAAIRKLHKGLKGNGVPCADSMRPHVLCTLASALTELVSGISMVLKARWQGFNIWSASPLKSSFIPQVTGEVLRDNPRALEQSSHYLQWLIDGTLHWCVGHVP